MREPDQSKVRLRKLEPPPSRHSSCQKNHNFLEQQDQLSGFAAGAAQRIVPSLLALYGMSFFYMPSQTTYSVGYVPGPICQECARSVPRGAPSPHPIPHNKGLRGMG
jgi:hypothetical protein